MPIYPNSCRKILSIFLPNALDNCIYNKKIVGLPWYLNTYVLIYNKDFFKNASLTQADIPKTFSELVDITKKYKDNSGRYALFGILEKIATYL
ncbi:MAG: extracellular solute-binding protein [Ignavibacteriales bacterium]|nr:extracellular solute-binding protein [Ignavibacteriales bacterium]